ncbi:hypothetical protein DXG03_005780 [Asterophora parasitica]|uniref:Uncharacterized protein n=1 Tax=Asterophora parasitica TaxID=117018 RepID=A0A9P7G023_9AGAR|nr:hypothetical protein DXG03_005780 [Asterophora parasitica]
MDDKTANTFSYAVGGFGIICSIVSSIIFCRHRFSPTVQIKVLIDTLHETRQLHEELKIEGILPSSVAHKFQVELKELEDKAFGLRNHTYKCTNAAKEVTAVFQGLLTAIQKGMVQVLQLRENLVTVSEEHRRARLQDELDCLLPNYDNDYNGETVTDTVSTRDAGLPVHAEGSTPGSSLDNRAESPNSRPESASETASAVETLVGLDKDHEAGSDRNLVLPTSIQDLTTDYGVSLYLPKITFFRVHVPIMRWPNVRGPLLRVPVTDSSGTASISASASETASMAETLVNTSTLPVKERADNYAHVDVTPNDVVTAV